MTAGITEGKTAPHSLPALGTTSLQNEITDLQGSTKETSQSSSQGNLNPTTQESTGSTSGGSMEGSTRQTNAQQSGTLQGGSEASTVLGGSQETTPVGTLSGKTTDAVPQTGN